MDRRGEGLLGGWVCWGGAHMLLAVQSSTEA